MTNVPVFLFCLIFTIRPVPGPAIHPPAATGNEKAMVLPGGMPAKAPASMSEDILRYVNQHRRSMGLRALQPNSFISSVALGHSRDMLARRVPFGHEGFRARIDRIRKKLGAVHVAAENVASGPMSAREVVDGWLNSPGHRRNIEGDFRLTGIGLAARSDGMIYFTQIFTK
jgi:uncharacterized protein YkwD